MRIFFALLLAGCTTVPAPEFPLPVLYHEGKTIYPINDRRNPNYQSWEDAWAKTID